MSRLCFTKVQGLGNDFILIDLLDSIELAELDTTIELAREHAARLCDRRLGIGADGILLVGPRASSTVASMVVVNADGSRPEMCGNGLRCVVAHVGARLGESAFVVQTDSGPLACSLISIAGSLSTVGVEMGAATILDRKQPEAGGGRSFVSVSIGNPHAICFVNEDEQPETLARRRGPGIEEDPVYLPAKTNVEFAAIRGSDEPPSIELWVWERGVGITTACGTGACATVAAAVSESLVPADTAIAVDLPGGRLEISVASEGGAVSMVGPACVVYSGEVDWPSSSFGSESDSP